MSMLCALPIDVLENIFCHLHDSSQRNDAVNLGFTCKYMLSLLRSTQRVLALPQDARSMRRAVGDVLNALPTNTTTLSLSNASLDETCSASWESLSPLSRILELRIPKGQPESMPWTVPISMYTRRRATEDGGNLVRILRNLPNLTSLSIVVDPPGPAHALVDILAHAALSRQFLTKIATLNISASGMYLHHQAEATVPELVRRLPNLTSFSLTLPPRIIPNSFISEVVAALRESKKLRETRLSLPFYVFPPSYEGYAAMPHLKSITLHHGAPLGRTKNRQADSFYQHLALWTELETVCLFDAPKAAIDEIIEVLRHRVCHVEVMKRSALLPLIICNWNPERRYATFRSGIEVADVTDLFHKWFTPVDGKPPKCGTTLSCAPPSLDTGHASSSGLLNCCVFNLVQEC